MRRRDQLEEESDEEDTGARPRARAEQRLGELARGAPARRREQGGSQLLSPSKLLLLFAGLLCSSAAAAEGQSSQLALVPLSR